MPCPNDFFSAKKTQHALQDWARQFHHLNALIIYARALIGSEICLGIGPLRFPTPFPFPNEDVEIDAAVFADAEVDAEVDADAEVDVIATDWP
eukprot:CAMPEP_0184503714 /NCGR_PEP_ID=MMETSP0113_2-20130426/52056_1 /TAXON_ID=91329 /ORGANISM="Norrisiella sphaerica, Strain BC52" /LENGTH=92 /DNA_ID=CAMNT_0026893263 /DNA_START=1524 /DNA_END=1800 /DNA_ORIENTATION=+